MKITVVLCTYNRCQSLAKALASAAALTLPDSVEWEVLVVDNNSRDQTREVVEDFCGRYPGRFRYLFEPQPGKSYALNAGIREARGDVLAFMDDDVTVERSWLQNLTAGLQDSEWAGAGGRILPIWTSSPPRWLPLDGPDATAPLAAFDKGDEPGELSEPPFGTNMAFRKSLFDKYGGFRIDLGPRPNTEIRSEDTEFGGRLLAAGERLRYEPSAVVYHPVPENRLTKDYFLAWRFDHGRAGVRVFGTPPGAKRWHGIPLVEFRRLVVWTMRWVITVEPRKRFANKLNVWTIAGRIAESYCQVQGFFLAQRAAISDKE
jgi:glycosyltransferase involved in cell wall biosynthesis